ncbi:MAG: hypothetical protein WBQ89_02600 [Candidatus Acidiferrum sp.]
MADAKVLGRAKIDISRLTILTNPRAESRELILDAWRLERDYFCDRNMHGLDWTQVRDRYLPLVDRVADRDELNNLIAQMVSELSILHIFVVRGDARKPSDQIDLASLGAVLRRDEKAGGEIWLSASDVLVDQGIATAAEYSVYGPERKWLIEGHSVDPDFVVDNLPHVTFSDSDAQLDKDPRQVPAPPPYPIKALKYEK